MAAEERFRLDRPLDAVEPDRWFPPRPARSAKIGGRAVAAAAGAKEVGMDGETFDRLSVAVHRLRDGATRRQALRAVAAGGTAGLLTRLRAGEAEAACVGRRDRCSRGGQFCGHRDRDVGCDRLPRHCRRDGERCCGRDGTGCAADCDCCRGFACDGGRCRSGDGDGGGRRCGGVPCRRGWSCCRFRGVARCIDRDHLHCCRGGICPRGWDCCGRDGGCCSKGWKCCGRSGCCPDGWRCTRGGCEPRRNARVATASAEPVPFAEPVRPDGREWVEQGWMTDGSGGEPA